METALVWFGYCSFFAAIAAGFILKLTLILTGVGLAAQYVGGVRVPAVLYRRVWIVAGVVVVALWFVKCAVIFSFFGLYELGKLNSLNP